MSEGNSEPGEQDLDRRLEEARAEGRTHRPSQEPATESANQSLAEQRRAVSAESDERDR